MQFTDPNLPAILESASREQVDAAAFGVIAMDETDAVTVYNRFESERAGLSVERVLGKAFFEVVAPCTNNALVRGRFSGGDLDEVIDYVFTLRMRVTPVRLRLIQQPTTGRRYILVQPR